MKKGTKVYKPEVKPMYACNKCCHYLHKAGERCDHCHRGKAVQIYPVIKDVTKVMPISVKRPHGNVKGQD